MELELSFLMRYDHFSDLMGGYSVPNLEDILASLISKLSPLGLGQVGIFCVCVGTRILDMAGQGNE